MPSNYQTYKFNDVTLSELEIVEKFYNVNSHAEGARKAIALAAYLITQIKQDESLAILNKKGKPRSIVLHRASI